MSHTPRRVWLPLVLVAACPALTACAQRASVVIDGDLTDWVGPADARATDDHVFVRFSPGEAVTLQGGQRCTRVLLDVDDEAGTGMTHVPEGGATLGVDLEIQISPLPDEAGGGLGLGAAVYAHRPAGVRTRLSHADVGLVFAPTYAAGAYELRLDREPSGAAARLSGVPTLERSQRVRGVVVQADREGGVLWASEPFSAGLEHGLDAGTPPAA